MAKFNFTWNQIPRTIEILSKYDAEKEFTKQENNDAFVISISNPIEQNNAIPFTCANIRVKFDDIEDFDIEGECITDTDCLLILESFFSQLHFGTTKFAVHCTAGISRSSGIALGLMSILGKEDTIGEMLKHRRFSFNKTCARKTFDVFNRLGKHWAGWSMDRNKRLEMLENALDLNYKIPFDLEGEFTVDELLEKFGR
jgi:predicted protein tyrosine phosphatase